MRLNARIAALLASPLAVLLLATLLIPAGTFLIYSFYTFHLLEPHPAFQLGNYTAALSDPLYHQLALNSFLIAAPTTIVSVLFGYVVAYYLAFVAAPRGRQLVLGLVVISMMASYLVRIYAWRTLLGENGILNKALETGGLIHKPIGFLLFSRFAVVVAQVNLFLPFAVLVLFASLSGIPSHLIDGARDLGARRREALRRVVIPLSGRAILSAAALTFFLSAGDYITPVLLGGTNSATFGTAISNQLLITGNYALGAALSFVMVAAFVVVYWVLRLSMRGSGVIRRAQVA